jgi:hypothetical protein
MLKQLARKAALFVPEYTRMVIRAHIIEKGSVLNEKRFALVRATNRLNIQQEHARSQ